MTMALSSSPHSPAVLTASQFSTHSPFPKLTTSHFFFSTGKPSNQTSYFNLSSSYSTIDRSWSAKVSFFPAFLKKGKSAKVLKEELLEAIDSLDRGADAIPEDQQRVDEVGPFPSPLLCLVIIFGCDSEDFITLKLFLNLS
jgi:hypothetical protein